MEEVVKAAGRRRIRAVKVGARGDEAENEKIDRVGSIKELDFDGDAAPQLVGGTTWAFSAPQAAGRFGYLFVDEAGQVSLANLVGMSPAADNIVLVGDQMQLGQPIQGSHPGESGTSALEYLLDGQATIPPHLGVFLPITYRMHPEVCKFISGAVYQDRLQATAATAQRILSAAPASRFVSGRAGLLFVPVEHEGNAQASEEEVEVIALLVDELKQRRRHDGRRLGDEDILIVAPFNMQVRALRERLPSARVGSIDLFQGQEAAVVIVSMCATSGEASQRGLEFLFSPNRLNVAISRAETLAIVVGSPRLEHTRVSSIDQMRLVNLFCRFTSQAARPSHYP
jgi:superfamily I DNA and/or RNA helicase